VIIDNPNRYRVSTRFTIVKVFVYFGLFAIIFNLIKDINNDTFSPKLLVVLGFGILLLIGVHYFVRTRKIIEYDDIKHILYVYDPKGKVKTEISVERIDKILYSAVGLGRGSHSYVIIYRDFLNQKQKVRLFPIPFNNDIETIITDTKLKNPDLVTKNWSIGWNEFFD